MTISGVVRRQILAEGPQHEDGRAAVVYVDQAIEALSNTELLDRISDAYEAIKHGDAA